MTRGGRPGSGSGSERSRRPPSRSSGSPSRRGPRLDDLSGGAVLVLRGRRDPPGHPDADAGAWGLLQLDSGPAAVTALYLLLLVGALCLVFGFKTRLAAVVVFVCLVSFARRDPWVLNSGDLLVIVLAFYLMLAPSGSSLSVDRWLGARPRFWEFPKRSLWPLRLIQVQVSLVYFFAVWEKVRGETWNDVTAISYAFRIEDLERFPVPAFVTDSLLLVNLLT